jgi:UDP-N-acetylbacillosamine N-acetyltransferase
MNQGTYDPKGELVIYGAWHYGRVVAETARLCGWTVAGFIDPNPPAGVNTLTEFPVHAKTIVAIGDNQLRAHVHRKLVEKSRKLVSVLHPTALVSPSATVEDGCFLAEYAVVRTKSNVGAGALLNSGAVVSHDCRVGVRRQGEC